MDHRKRPHSSTKLMAWTAFGRTRASCLSGGIRAANPCYLVKESGVREAKQRPWNLQISLFYTPRTALFILFYNDLRYFSRIDNSNFSPLLCVSRRCQHVTLKPHYRLPTNTRKEQEMSINDQDVPTMQIAMTAPRRNVKLAFDNAVKHQRQRVHRLGMKAQVVRFSHCRSPKNYLPDSKPLEIVIEIE